MDLKVLRCMSTYISSMLAWNSLSSTWIALAIWEAVVSGSWKVGGFRGKFEFEFGVFFVRALGCSCAFRRPSLCVCWCVCGVLGV